MFCNDVRDKLELHLYGELSAEESAAIREHLRQCADCAAVFSQLERAKVALDEWTSITPVLPVSATLEQIERSEAAHVLTTILPAAGTSPRNRFMPWLMSAAAVLAITACVLTAGVQVRKADGQLTISFGRGKSAPQPVNDIQGGTPVDDDDTLTAGQIDAMLAEINEQLDGRTAESLRLVRDQFRELQREQDKRFLALVNTLSTMREEDNERFEQAIQRVALEARDTKAALNDVARSVATRPDNTKLDGLVTPGRKEIVP